MTKVILERGRLALGMRRLSIIDLEGGHQPIFNEDGNVGVVLNGEIYNFRELTAQLKDRGHTFRTRSDSEVVAHAYEEWGPDCVERLQGMFALAVWDGVGLSEFRAVARCFWRATVWALSRFTTMSKVQSPKSKVRLTVGVSDRQDFGHLDLGLGLAFFSLRRCGRCWRVALCRANFRVSAVESYLLFGSVSEPMTLVEGVFSLPPGHRMTIDAGSDSERPADTSRALLEALPRATGAQRPREIKLIRVKPAVQVRSLLEESVRKPLDCRCSGRSVSEQRHRFNCARGAGQSRSFRRSHFHRRFSGRQSLAKRRLPAGRRRRLGTTHQEVMLSGDEMLARLDDAVGALDLPSIDGINTYFVSCERARRPGLKVALSGLGGDEVFGGYNTFRANAAISTDGQRRQRVPAGVRSAMAAAMAEARRAILSGDAARKIAALWKSPESLPDPYYFGRAAFHAGPGCRIDE